MKIQQILGIAIAFSVAALVSAGEVTGKVSYRERIALPPNSIVTVRLEDATRADAPAGLISESKFVTGRNQVPFSFKLPYVDSAIQRNLQYFVRATIHSDGKLIYTSTEAYPVINNGVKKLDVRLMRIQSNGLEAGKWTLSDLNGRAVKSNNRGGPFIEFHQDKGEISSNTGVNGLGGTYKLTGNKLTIKPGAQTMMAGPPEMMDQERAFVNMLKSVDGYRVNGNTLELLRGNRVVAKFRK